GLGDDQGAYRRQQVRHLIGRNLTDHRQIQRLPGQQGGQRESEQPQGGHVQDGQRTGTGGENHNEPAGSAGQHGEQITHYRPQRAHRSPTFGSRVLVGSLTSVIHATWTARRSPLPEAFG